ncbi:signal peptide peptidase SppA [Bacillus marinisedimentorum]|uniref:signal peptide peptidase SppA n=1 Tax=Bacillus marinisedimentorum TaxID=1821260 RepID=UPI0007DFD60B|nr:signal peptide peptidase SppA [Bacillus marinisedimentorum]
MDNKRWLALGIAVVLFMFSIGVQFVSSLASANLSGFQENFLFGAEEGFEEKILEQGSQDKKIAVLHVNGTIQDTGDATSFFESVGYHHRSFLRKLDQAAEDRAVGGIILHINSPGGGVAESAEIHDRLTGLKEKYDKPIYVVMGSIAASGGYYISTPADKIFASPETLTGSLGVIMQGVNYGELAEKLGVEFETIKSGPHKDIMSPNRDMTEKEREILQTMVNNSYESFVDVISEGREIPREKVYEIADGRVYDGKQAKEINLIDEFGYLDDTIAAMKKEHKLNGATVFEYKNNSGLGSMFEMTAGKLFTKDAETQLLLKLASESNSPRMMYLYAR